MMGGGFTGQMDPRQMLMQMQMARQGMQRPMGGPFNAAAGMPQGMGMRSPNAPAPAPMAPQQQQSDPMQSMNMQMLMAALKNRQPQPGANAAKVNATNAGAMTADPMAQGAAQAADAQGQGGLLGFLGNLFKGVSF